MELCYDGALVLPSSYAVMDEEEMCYTEGGWSGRQVLKNVCGILAVFSLGYAGAAFRHFVEKNKGLSYGRMLRFIKAVPWQVKVAIGVCTAATLYALGSYDLF